MLSGTLRYWLCQLVGWGLYAGIGIYFRFVVYGDGLRSFFSDNAEKISRATKIYIYGTIITFVTAILVTHIIRYLFKQAGWLRFSMNRLILLFLASALLSGLGIFFGASFIQEKTGYSWDDFIISENLASAKYTEDKSGLSAIDYYSGHPVAVTAEQKAAVMNIRKTTGWYRNAAGEWKYERKSRLRDIYFYVILTSLWVVIYMAWHYVEKNRRDREDRLKLESMVKELELKTIKSHINPHFIFNALNSIRALVDENPERARTAITELSNILRSSMQAEKSETVPLEREMDIVRDYLALEQMRFEDRLKIEYHIDDDTLDQMVPPMMVQTLVENAIKHGVSKQMEGGTIRIYSDFVNNHYELRVQNTGTLTPVNGNGGFGLKSTQDRLKLLFGPESKFGIAEKDGLVEVFVELPVHIKN